MASVFTQADTIYALLTLRLYGQRRNRCPAEGERLFYAVGGRIEMNHGIIGKQVAIGIEFKVVAGFVEQHLLGIFQMLPHRQLSRMRIFANQRFKNF